MKRFFYFFILFLLITFFTYSQSKQPKFSINSFGETNCDIRCFINQQIENLGSKYFEKEKYNAFSSFQFNIDTSGFVVKLKANEHTTIFLFNLVDSILKLTNGKWTPQYNDGKKVESKAIILPIIYFSGISNNTKAEPTDFFTLNYFIYSTSNLFTPNEKKSYLDKPIYLKKESQKKISNIDFVDCYLLNPIYIQPGIII